MRNVVTDFAVENATLSLQPGPAPIDDPGKLFTGKAPDGAAYALEWELWYCVEDHTSFTSSRPGNEERRALNMLLTSFEPGKTYVYYVHSYAPRLCDAAIAATDYGMRFSAALARDNFFGTQFHPEKSGAAGSRILRNFLTLK